MVLPVWLLLLVLATAAMLMVPRPAGPSPLGLRSSQRRGRLRALGPWRPCQAAGAPGRRRGCGQLWLHSRALQSCSR